MYPEQPDFETPYVFSIDNTAGDTPMTDKTRETIAEGNPHKGQIRSTETGPMWDKRMLKAEAWKEGVAFVLAIPEIKEGQELLAEERAKSNRRKGITWRPAN